MRYALAVDGGNSKTDLALVREDGELLATAHGRGSSPYHLGVEGSLDVIEKLFERALDKAGLEPPADAAELLLAGVDFPSEEAAVVAAVERRNWARRVSVDNDTFAVLRAGTDSGWGIAVVCGAGINCVGVAPDGTHARFPALGWTTGDWGGGGDVGQEAVYAAARSEDGRGPQTSLEQRVPAYFELATPLELAEAVHFRRVDGSRAIELPSLRRSSTGSRRRSSRSRAWRSRASGWRTNPSRCCSAAVCSSVSMRGSVPRSTLGSPRSGLRSRPVRRRRPRCSAPRCSVSTRSTRGPTRTQFCAARWQPRTPIP